MRTPSALAILLLSAVVSTAECATYSLLVENDKWGHPKSDLNYTMGVALNGSRDGRPSSGWASIYAPLTAINDVLHIDAPPDDKSRSFWTFGDTTFTPDKITSPSPIPDDRPYSTLLFLGVGYSDRRDNHDVESELRLGLLGTGIGRYVQTWIHERCCKDDLPAGWSNQVGQGGSPTFLYHAQWTRRYLETERQRLGFSAGAEVGYYVRALAGASFLFGLTSRDFRALGAGGPNQRMAPFGPVGLNQRPAMLSQAERDETSPHSRGVGLWIQYEASAFAYNELLQGAWSGTNRVRISYRNIERVVHQANTGFDLAFIPKLLPFLADKEFHIYVTQSWRSADLKFPNVPRNHYWGGATLSLDY